jgi:hypothetical protein
VPANQACGGCQQFPSQPSTTTISHRLFYRACPDLPPLASPLFPFNLALLLVSAPLPRSLTTKALRTRGYNIPNTRYDVLFTELDTRAFLPVGYLRHPAPTMETLTVNLGYGQTPLPSTSFSSSPPHTFSTVHAYTARFSSSFSLSHYLTSIRHGSIRRLVPIPQSWR